MNIFREGENFPTTGEILTGTDYSFLMRKKVFDTVLAEGLFGELANSFLIEAGNRTGEQRVIYSKYSNERARQFAIRTDICKKADGGKKVSENMHFIRKEESISVIWRVIRKIVIVLCGQ